IAPLDQGLYVILPMGRRSIAYSGSTAVPPLRALLPLEPGHNHATDEVTLAEEEQDKNRHHHHDRHRQQYVILGRGVLRRTDAELTNTDAQRELLRRVQDDQRKEELVVVTNERDDRHRDQDRHRQWYDDREQDLAV